MKCSQSCGDGIQNRTRKCDNPTPANGGADCVGQRIETRECSIKPCPVNGGFGIWLNYSTCSVSCGGGVQFRKRNCDSPSPKYGGKDCDGPSRENRICGEIECPGSLRFFGFVRNYTIYLVISLKQGTKKVINYDFI